MEEYFGPAFANLAQLKITSSINETEPNIDRFVGFSREHEHGECCVIAAALWSRDRLQPKKSSASESLRPSLT
jgi:hypothetical protein